MKKIILLPLFCLSMLAAACFTPTLAAQTTPRRIVIEAKRFSYTPGEITLKKGEPVILILKSQDVSHGLRLREFDVNLKVKAGGTAEAEFTPTQTGDFAGHCSVFCGSGHGSMMLKLHVVE
ncbi:MAG: cupredoxin domain-containing protein [Acidobacteriota bacterium]